MLLETPIADCMTTDLVTLNTEDTVDLAAKIFKDYRLHHIPVTDEAGQLKGIISKSDFLSISYGASLFQKHNTQDYNQAMYRSLLTKDIMTKDVISLSPADTIKSALDIFIQNKFRAIPIENKGKLVGIVCPINLIQIAYGYPDSPKNAIPKKIFDHGRTTG